jgi:hypothetical protein
LFAEVLTRREGQPPHPQQALPLASVGVLRHLWDSRYGPILIEVIDDQVFVNGDRVEPVTPATPRASSPL